MYHMYHIDTLIPTRIIIIMVIIAALLAGLILPPVINAVEASFISNTRPEVFADPVTNAAIEAVARFVEAPTMSVA